MPDNLRVRFVIESSEATDYSRPYLREQYEREYTPDEIVRQRVEATAGGATVSITNIDTPSAAFFQNTSTTSGETVTLAYTNASGAISVALGIGAVHFTEDLTNADVTLTSATGTPLVDLWVAGT